MNSRENWENYYNRVRPVSFLDHQYSYNRILDIVKSLHETVLNPEVPHNFLLGGFHPYNRTPETFLTFCRNIHPNSSDKALLVDFNKSPLTRLQIRHPYKVQADLTRMPFSDGSINMMFLDYTLNFINDSQLPAFSRESARILGESGLIVSSFDFTASGPLGVFRASRANCGLDFNGRDVNGISKLCPDLTVVAKGFADTYFVSVLASRDGIYSSHRGDCFDLLVPY